MIPTQRFACDRMEEHPTFKHLDAAFREGHEISKRDFGEAANLLWNDCRGIESLEQARIQLYEKLGADLRDSRPITGKAKALEEERRKLEEAQAKFEQAAGDLEATIMRRQSIKEQIVKTEFSLRNLHSILKDEILERDAILTWPENESYSEYEGQMMLLRKNHTINRLLVLERSIDFFFPKVLAANEARLAGLKESLVKIEAELNPSEAAQEAVATT